MAEDYLPFFAVFLAGAAFGDGLAAGAVFLAGAAFLAMVVAPSYLCVPDYRKAVRERGTRSHSHTIDHKIKRHGQQTSQAMVLLATLCPSDARIFRGFANFRQDEFPEFAKKFSLAGYDASALGALLFDPIVKGLHS